jgi:hypothetical protein
MMKVRVLQQGNDIWGIRFNCLNFHEWLNFNQCAFSYKMSASCAKMYFLAHLVHF